MQRRAIATASWLVVGTIGVLGVLRPVGTPRTHGWFHGFWALYMVMGAVGTASTVRGHRLTAAGCLLAGGVGTITSANIASETPGLPLPAVVHAALLATGLAILAATRRENRPQVGLAVTVSVALVFLGSALLAEGAVGTALVGLLIGPVTAGVILGAPLALAVTIGNQMVIDRTESATT